MATDIGQSDHWVFCCAVCACCFRCVDVPSSGSVHSKRYLFIQATVECSAAGWQAPLWVLMLTLLAFPAILVWFLRYATQEVRTCARGVSDDRCVWGGGGGGGASLIGRSC